VAHEADEVAAVAGRRQRPDESIRGILRRWRSRSCQFPYLATRPRRAGGLIDEAPRQRYDGHSGRVSRLPRHPPLIPDTAPAEAARMILGKLWKALAAQMNKIANFFWTADPVAQLQYEYDKAVDQMKEGREGLEQYRALVERVMRQVDGDRQHVASLEARVKAYLKAGERETASKFAIELQKAKKELAENEAQLKMHETAYNNNVTKVKHATKKLADLKQKIQKYDAELKLSRAEAELAKLATSFNFDITTDFGQIEDVIQDKISLNRAKVRVAADLSGEGLEQIKQEEAVEQAMADQALREFEIEMGMVTPETAGVTADDKELGSERVRQTSG
jgi:phage shock protein A